MKVEGSCHCGQIRYEADVDPEVVGLCNCTDCQVLSGTAFRVSAPVPRDRFRLISGQPRIYVKTADSGSKRAQAFCGNCGSPIYASAAVEEPPSYSLRVGTVKQRAQLPPKRRIWCQSALGWAQNVSVLPGVERQ